MFTAFAKSLAFALDGFNISTVHKRGSKEKTSAEPGFESGAAGSEARMLPQCCAAPSLWLKLS